MSSENRQDSFREEARRWLTENFPATLAHQRPPGIAGFGAKFRGDWKVWQSNLGEKGWSAPTWPAEFGGGGLTPQEARVLAEEMAAIGAISPIGGFGIMMWGPTLLDVGTEEQKQRYLPPIIRGDIHWCQGYSEPGAGSDLANLQSFAEDKGDHFILNGSKVWTSGALEADWMYGVFRTDRNNKYEGISFLTLDMKSPGVEVKPITLISGQSPFNEVFFNDVVIPKEDLIGEKNQGWNIGKRLLLHERQGIAGSGGGSVIGGSYDLEKVARDYIGLEDGKLADGAMRERIAMQKMFAHAYALTRHRFGDEAAVHGPSPAVGIMKVAWARDNQNREELLIEMLGNRGLGWEGAGFSDKELLTVRTWLRSKANSIEGGTTEINLNLVAKRVLGLKGY
ncbi:MAG: acyl-CoA dehydrogenase family protein [Kiritimatiellia bacterium]|nr:acyl-CoA dehydrogenase family protein [Pseudomonadales bacterium]MDP6469391.1 acyl-CoA dehydrogenase family protein [Pseudomonadales bacterium]MDP6828991.1 acyl-CoA dehydrogenase family protein [Pseudomonadales bacterium]MDP7024698.1 acyl-CoA dehydrogenase family protein [Kiritimatiellia bacterium]